MTPEKLGADLKVLISGAEALLRPTVGETAEAGREELEVASNQGDTNLFRSEKNFQLDKSFPTYSCLYWCLHQA